MPPYFFGMTTTGLAHDDVECWVRPARGGGVKCLAPIMAGVLVAQKLAMQSHILDTDDRLLAEASL